VKSQEIVRDEDDKAAMAIDEALIGIDTDEGGPGEVAEEAMSSESDSGLSEPVPARSGVRRTTRKSGKVNYSLAPAIEAPKPKAKKSAAAIKRAAVAVAKKEAAKESAKNAPVAEGSKSGAGQKRARASK
jgi:hypothetical protein